MAEHSSHSVRIKQPEFKLYEKPLKHIVLAKRDKYSNGEFELETANEFRMKVPS